MSCLKTLRTREGRLARLKEARQRLEETEREVKEQQTKKLEERQREEQAWQRPSELLADAGYFSEENTTLEDEHTELFITTKKDWKQRKALRDKGPPRGRIPQNATPRDLMERKLLTRRGRQAYKQRGPSIEAVFGQMAMRGLSRFWLRGAEKVKTEWSLWCTTHNLLKLWRSGWWPAGAQEVEWRQ